MPRNDGNLYITFFSMGQGDCTLITCPNGKTVMVDCGTARWEDTSLQEVRDEVYSDNFLKNYNKVDALIFTHPDKDHYNQLYQVLETDVRLETVYHSAQLTNYYIDAVGPWIQHVANKGTITAVTLNAASPKPVAAVPVLSGKTAANIDWSIAILASNVAQATGIRDNSTPNNTGSVVTLIVYEDVKILICGDATLSTERFLCDNFANQIRDVTVLQVPHHGSLTSSSVEFIKLTNPEIVIVSSALDSGSLHLPRLEVLDRYMDPDGTTFSGVTKRLQNSNAHDVYYYVEEEVEIITPPSKKRKLDWVISYKSSSVSLDLQVTGSNGIRDFEFSPST
jgi:beta-lactamase superfamily II metal-dependent hydrolase